MLYEVITDIRLALEKFAKVFQRITDFKLTVVVGNRRAQQIIEQQVAYASRNSSDFPEIMIHEAGHTIARLMDEYEGDLPDIVITSYSIHYTKLYERGEFARRVSSRTP